MKELKLTLTVNETNLLLKALGNMPFNQVTELVGKIHAQAQQQLAGKEEPMTVTAKNGTH